MSSRDKEKESSIGFFSRIRSGVASTVHARPVPGKLKAKYSDEEKVNQIGLMPIENDIVDTGDENDSVSGERKSQRELQFEFLLSQENVDLHKLKKLSWNGIPARLRCVIWQILLGYLPTNKNRRVHAISRKRLEYQSSVDVYFRIPESYRSSQEIETMTQILKDLHRCCPDSPFFQQEPIQRAMERILYIWSIRHPASGYVQGMDDVLTPLLFMAMQPYAVDVLRMDVGALNPAILMDVEADAYWCLSKLLDNIQDHYTFSQPGIQRMLLRLEDLVHRIDAELYAHFQEESVQFFQFSFRWMNCLLLRELPMTAVIRLWDTYLAEGSEGFENFHVYVSAVILKTFKDTLMAMQFQELLIFLQELPTSGWGEDDMEPILSQAFILSTLFENSPSHLS